MKFVVAIDSFKGAASSIACGEAAKKGILSASPTAEVVCIPIADGGEGMVEAVLEIDKKAETVRKVVTGPLFEQVEACYAVLGDTAVIEMAAASGLPLVPEEKRNPMETTTLGTGELILDAVQRGCRRILLGVGGSATNDGGMGIGTALGLSYKDKDGNTLIPAGKSLQAVVSIEANIPPALKNVTIQIASDVQNPLFGPNGAAVVFSPQKGADSEMVVFLDEGLRQMNRVLQRQTGQDYENFPGAGAAGGCPLPLLACFGATLVSGIDLMLELTGFDGALSGADCVFTGEGKIDGQSVGGKVLSGIGRRAKAANVPVVAFCGSLAAGYEPLYDMGITAVFPIQQGPVTLAEAMEKTTANLQITAEQVTRLFAGGK